MIKILKYSLVIMVCFFQCLVGQCVDSPASIDKAIKKDYNVTLQKFDKIHFNQEQIKNGSEEFKNAYDCAEEHEGYTIFAQEKEEGQKVAVGIIYVTGKGANSDLKIVLHPQYYGQGIGTKAEVQFLQQLRFKECIGIGIDRQNIASLKTLKNVLKELQGNYQITLQNDNSTITKEELIRELETLTHPNFEYIVSILISKLP